jgi:hypothetical protein
MMSCVSSAAISSYEAEIHLRTSGGLARIVPTRKERGNANHFGGARPRLRVPGEEGALNTMAPGSQRLAPSLHRQAVEAAGESGLPPPPPANSMHQRVPKQRGMYSEMLSQVGIAHPAPRGGASACLARDGGAAGLGRRRRGAARRARARYAAESEL